jgi:RNA polymerase sigma factor (sigma-70 family)
LRLKFEPTTFIDDQTIWSQIKRGEEKAFSILFEKHYSDLVRYGNSLFANDDKVQDCVQDVFTDLWIYRESLAENVVVKAYLLSSVRKRIIRLGQRDRIFKQSTDIKNIDFLFDFSIEQQLISDEETASKVLHLNNLINNLPGRQKEALYLRYNQELGIDQIAELMEVNYQSASNIIFRAIQSLRREWNSNISLLLLLSYTLS